MTESTYTRQEWEEAFPPVEYPRIKVTPEQELVIVNVEREIGRAPFVTLDPVDMSDGTADEFPVLVWTMPEPWSRTDLGDESDTVETETDVFTVEGDGTCHIGGNVGAASWEGLRDAYARLGRGEGR